MLKSLFLFLSLSFSVWAETSKTPEYPVLEIGARAPDWSLLGVDGKTHQLSDYADKKVLMVVFTSNHCPEAQASEARLKKLVEDYRDKSFAMIAISGNHPNSLRLD